MSFRWVLALLAVLLTAETVAAATEPVVALQFTKQSHSTKLLSAQISAIANRINAIATAVPLTVR